MVGIIVSTHGSLSQELVKSAEMIFGPQENMGCVSFKPGEAAEVLISQYEELAKSLDCADGILLLVDIYGGSPFNAASLFALKSKNIEVIAGVNLPMLLEVFANKEGAAVSSLAYLAKGAGKEGIKEFVRCTVPNVKEDEL
jgi:PTS system mannose-specific IIA component